MRQNDFLKLTTKECPLAASDSALLQTVILHICN